MAVRYILLSSRNDFTYEAVSRQNPLEMSDENFIKEFRMTKDDVSFLNSLLKEDLVSRGKRQCDLTAKEKILISLKTLASGSFQNSVKDSLIVSQPTVSRCVNEFVEAVCKKANQFIYMPRTASERETIKQGFYNVARFPGVLGCVDGTHIPIIAPSEDEYAYVNRKNFHSINVQAVCDFNMIFTDVVAKWPGSHHDSFILSSSAICYRFELGEYGNGWLLGDSGYGLKQWLITPIANPATTEERQFNNAHKKTRSLIERSFGILKSRWRILDHTGGTLCYTPEKVAKITIACCVLHNICRRRGTPLVATYISDRNILCDDASSSSTETSRSGERQRSRIISMMTTA